MEKPQFDSIHHAKAIAYAISKLQKDRASKQRRELVWTHPKFEKQNAFINDESTLIAAKCPRRSGKSEGLGRKQLSECFKYPGSNQLYIGLTLASARAIMWEPIVKRLNEEMKLGGKPNESRLELKFEHKPGVVSQYVLFGADASSREIDKKLGGKYRSIVIDEAAFFKQNLQDMVYEKLLPCVADWDGWIALASTTSEYTRGLFYDVTNGTEPGWSVHEWTGSDNPFMKDKLARQIAMLKKNKPRIEETPAFRRMYLNEWVIDHDSFCYKFDSDVNDIDSIPHTDELINVLGIDLGFNDPTAFSLLSYSEYDPSCYIRHAYKRGGMIISEVADRIKWYIDKYSPVACVIDNASKQAVEELKQKFSLPLIAAEKTGKAEFIEIMNSDFILGNIKVLPEAEDLKKEYGQLIWDKEKLPRKIEHPGCENHICFVAGTEIRTPSGITNIEDLKVGDLVETRQGAKRIKYTIARDAYVIKLVLSNGRTIICTPEHPFYSEGKWIQAKDLKSNSKLLSWSQHQQEQKKLDLMDMSTGDTQEIDISKDRNQKQKLSVYTCTEKYGLLKEAQYLKDIIFITKTEMLTTIDCAIWNAYQLKIILRSTGKAEVNGLEVSKTSKNLKILGRLHQSGINQKKVVNGTSSMVKKQLALSKQHVHGAKQNIVSHTWPKTKMGAVHKSALQQKEGQVVSMTYREHAYGAKQNLKLTDILNKETVHVSALEPITSIGKETVYNITVEDVHEYFANDILVSNCDAALYAYRYCYQYRFEKRPKKLTAEDHIEQMLESQWEGEQNEEYWER